MKFLNILSILSVLLFIRCDDTEPILSEFEGAYAGGETTVFVANSQSFATPAPNLSMEALEQHLEGDLAFEQIFVSGSSPVNGGLGPIFNNNSCIACHPADGRAPHPIHPNDISGLFLKISIPGTGENNSPKPVPGFGTQLQHQSNYGYDREATMEIRYETIPVTFKDGTVVNLRKPIYSLSAPYTNMPENVLLSPRIGMPVFGLGLLEAIPESAILAHADKADGNNDGISGKPNYVWNPLNNQFELGRFGWKAGAPTILLQSAGAYNEDMGITNIHRPIESSYGQSNSDPESTSPEVSLADLENVTFYTKTLGVPAARNINDPSVINGQQVFKKINCSACHTPSFETGKVTGIPEISKQKIYPYTDMLLHDMGDALADNRPEFDADGKEWKTRPLWGIGLTAVTNGHTNFLHDGRARNLTEAILWHGGEAEASKDLFTELSASERDDLLLFLNAL